jgi:hypothetical protein
MKAQFFQVVGVLLLGCFFGALAQDYDPDVKNRGFVGLTGSFTFPQHQFKTNYANYYGGGISLGFNYDSANGTIGRDFSLSWSNDQFKISGGGYGVLNSYFLDYDSYIYIFSTGVSGGFSRFSIPGDAWTHLGNTTGTELLTENHYNQLSYSTDMGLRIPLKIMDIDCDYHLVTVERAWMYWHMGLSATIMELSQLPSSKIEEYAIKNGDMALAILMKAVSLGIACAWYRYNYEHHDWPWHDDKAMNYQKATIGISFYL